MKDVKFDKDLSIPPPSRYVRRSKYRGMQVGDSLLFPTRAAASGLLRYAKIVGWAMTSRTVEIGIRIWRVE